jgi:hypothetical protein
VSHTVRATLHDQRFFHVELRTTNLSIFVKRSSMQKKHNHVDLTRQ